MANLLSERLGSSTESRRKGLYTLGRVYRSPLVIAHGLNRDIWPSPEDGHENALTSWAEELTVKIAKRS